MALTRNKMASQHSFAMIPRSDIPRSRYMLQQSLKTTFNASALIPIYCEEILPGDMFQGSAELFGRFATPITPVLDNAELETFFFFVPNRIVWDKWEEFISGATDALIPVIQSPTGGFEPLSIYDYFGIPPSGQIDAAGTIEVNALPFRAYNLIWNEWFRDQNLMLEAPVETGDGPDDAGYYVERYRAKKHDYFTSSLPWPQKGTAVELPLGQTAPVIANEAQPYPYFSQPGGVWPGPGIRSSIAANNANTQVTFTAGVASLDAAVRWDPNTDGLAGTGLVTDLSAATAATINALRLAFQVQKMLEKDARGGSRYIEQIQVHFGVRPPDYRLQRPEYIGGGKSAVNTHPIAQTSESNETPQGNLAAFTTVHGSGHRFKYAATEHGYIIGLVNVRADLTYQQGLRKHWTRQTRYDYYFPTLAHLGEQPVMRKEIYTKGTTADETVFGYQERWAEYRYTPNQITGLFRSTTPNNIDVWHYSEEFETPPNLNDTFITDHTVDVIGRTLAVGSEAYGQQILLDALFRVSATRPMPTYSVPGLIDHF